MTPRFRRALVFLVLPVGFMLLFFAAPVGGLLGTAFHGAPSTEHGAAPELFGPLKHFFSAAYYLNTLGLTLRIATIVTILSIIAGFPVAYYITRCGPRERVYLTLLVLSPLMISLVVRSFGWVVLLNRNGLVSSALQFLGITDGPVRLMYQEWTAIVGLIHVYMPFMVLSIMVALQDIDERWERAAASLGAGSLRRFATITLPLSVPGIMAGSVIVFTLTASSFVTPSILGGSRLKLTASLAYEQALFTLNWPFAAAISVVLLVVCMVILGIYSFLIRSRFFAPVFQRTAETE